MADKKISELTALTGANVATDDQLVIVDTSAALTKSITIDEFKNALDTATGFVRITGDTMTGNLSMGDNVKAIFGAGSDLQIYHDGSNSRIQDTATGSLILSGTNFYVNNTGDSKSYLAGLDGGTTPYVRLYHDGAARLDTTSTGIDVTGTVTADDISIADTSPTLLFNRTDRATDNKIIRFAHDGEDFQIQLANDAVSSVTPAIAINRTGMTLDSIAFYEDTGTTAKFFWDASATSLEITGAETSRSNNTYAFKVDNSAQTSNNAAAGAMAVDVNSGRAFTITGQGNVGIGTTSPSVPLHIDMGANNNALYIQSSDQFANIGLIDGIGSGKIIMDSGELTFTTGGNATTSFTGSTEAMRIDSSGRVGIGTTSPSVSSAGTVLKLERAGSTRLNISAANVSYSAIDFGDPDDVDVGRLEYYHANNAMLFWTNAAERMRIDSSGNLLVGKTNANATDVGIVANASGRLYATASGGSSIFNRTSSDGDIVDFRKDGTTVGSIASKDGDIAIGTGDTGLRFVDGSDAITPHNTSTNVGRGNFIDLGASGTRFKDLYLSGGVYLGGTDAANKLDSYEEGTWTPTTSSGSWTITTAKYVKIGKIVHCTFFVTATSTISAVDFTGLPFTPEDSAGGGVVAFQTHISGEVISIYVQSNSTWNLRIGSTHYGLGNTKTIRGVFSYTTAA